MMLPLDLPRVVSEQLAYLTGAVALTEVGFDWVIDVAAALGLRWNLAAADRDPVSSCPDTCAAPHFAFGRWALRPEVLELWKNQRFYEFGRKPAGAHFESI